MAIGPRQLGIGGLSKSRVERSNPANRQLQRFLVLSPSHEPPSLQVDRHFVQAISRLSWEFPLYGELVPNVPNCP